LWTRGLTAITAIIEAGQDIKAVFTDAIADAVEVHIAVLESDRRFAVIADEVVWTRALGDTCGILRTDTAIFTWVGCACGGTI
jgi:hypothetical protein